MKTITSFLLIALLITSNGCMTYTSVHRAEGTKYWSINGPEITPSKPEPGYYALLPLTVPADIVTCPFQGIWYGLVYGIGTGLGSTP
jgi:hypothetical protein